MTREQAKLEGLVRYPSHVPCRNGHVGERYVRMNNCVECQRRRDQSPEKLSENRIRAREWAKKHPDRFKSRTLAWRKANPHKVKEYRNKWREANIDRARALSRAQAIKYRRARPDLKRHYQALRETRKSGATPRWVDTSDLKAIYRNAPSGMSVDHIIPIANSLVCGLHVPWNLQYLSPVDNSRKKNKFQPQLAVSA